MLRLLTALARPLLRPLAPLSAAAPLTPQLPQVPLASVPARFHTGGREYQVC